LSNLESGSLATISNLLHYISGYIYTKIGACIIICKIFQLTTLTTPPVVVDSSKCAEFNLLRIPKSK